MTQFLAKFLGIYLVVIGVALFYQPERFRKVYKDLARNDPLLVYGGVIATLFGALIVSIHNVWVLAWPVIITLIGWLGLIKGIALLAVRDHSKLLGLIQDRPKDFFRTIGIIWTIFGVFLLYQGFIALG